MSSLTPTSSATPQMSVSSIPPHKKIFISQTSPTSCITESYPFHLLMDTHMIPFFHITHPWILPTCISPEIAFLSNSLFFLTPTSHHRHVYRIPYDFLWQLWFNQPFANPYLNPFFHLHYPHPSLHFSLLYFFIVLCDLWCLAHIFCFVTINYLWSESKGIFQEEHRRWVGGDISLW